MLSFAKNLGDILIVGLNSDVSVKLLKGEHRPINGQEQRLFMLEALKCVDNAIIFNETNSCALIEFIHPHIFVLGSEYKNKILPEHYSAKRCGCTIIYYNKITDISTSQIIEKIMSKG